MSNPEKERINRLLSILEIKMRKKSGSSLWGQHTSIFKGQGLNFQNLRTYIPGDDVRRIDWKVTGRLRRPYLKEFEQESEMTTYIVLDTSSSMMFGHGNYIKYEKALETTVYVSKVLTENEDRFGLFYSEGNSIKLLKPKKGEKNVASIFQELKGINHEPGQQSKITDILETILKVDRKRGGIVIVSDLLDYLSGLEQERFLKYLRVLNAKHDIFILHILDYYEINIPPMRNIRLQDLETGSVSLHSISMAESKELSKELNKRVKDLHLEFRKRGIQSSIIFTDDDALSKLIELFDVRKQKIRV